MNLMQQINETTSKALTRIAERLDGVGTVVNDDKSDAFALKAVQACAVTRNSISKQVDVAVRAAVASKADVSELRPAFQLLVGATSQSDEASMPV